jgi:uncharacterized SAM-binding protein YcdF (DUF218 family)
MRQRSRGSKASQSNRKLSKTPKSPIARRSPRHRKIPWAALLLLMVFLWVGYRQLVTQFSQPQAILVLGGSPDREKFAAELALEHPKLHVWVSSGSPKEYSEWVFDSAGVESERIHLDYRAVDTLTNFTTLVDDLKAEGITSFYLVTSDYHMRRAQWIAEVIGSNRGVVFKTVPIPSDRPSEPMIKAFRDSGRAMVWVVTGYTGAGELRRKNDELRTKDDK